jgi:voltage-gated potassium channel
VSAVDRPSRRDVIASVARVGVSAAVLFGAFALAPLDFRGRDVLGVRLAACVVLPVLVLGLQILAVARSPYPRLRAFEAVSIGFPLLVCLFASTYYAMGRASPASFNETLTRTDALYFTVTVFATVGFGDVVASSQAARIGVTVQMLADLLLIGVIARVLLGTARQRRAALETAPPGATGHPVSSPPRSRRQRAPAARAGRRRRSPGRRGRGRPGSEPSAP